MPIRRIILSAAVLCVVLLAATTLEAQFGRGRFQARTATAESFDGSFNFCRVVFRSGFNGDGGNWSVDYPRADINLSIRLAELTKTTISRYGDGAPNHLLVRLTDDELFECPFVMMTEVGSALFDEAEAKRLRTYVEKGGFVWADDFWGSYAWSNWISQLRKAFPASDFPIVDLPLDHPLFHAQFEVRRVPQIASINFWMGTGSTSERGADSAQAHARAIVDQHGRIGVLMTHNTDIGDSWEREADDPTYFLNFSVDGYALGVNTVLYAMTH